MGWNKLGISVVNDTECVNPLTSLVTNGGWLLLLLLRVVRRLLLLLSHMQYHCAYKIGGIENNN